LCAARPDKPDARADDANHQHNENACDATKQGFIPLGESADLVQRTRRSRDDRLIVQIAVNVGYQFPRRLIPALWLLL
jgi:hypothetical protein